MDRLIQVDDSWFSPQDKINTQVEALHEAVKLQRVLKNMNQPVEIDKNWFSPQGKNNLQDAKYFQHQLARNNTELWNMFTAKSFYSDDMLLSPVTSVHGALKIEFNNLLERTTELLEARSSPSAENKNIQNINYGYKRVHPIFGVQYVMQMTVKTKKKIRDEKIGETKQISSLYKKQFNTQRPFGNLFYGAEPLGNIFHYVNFLVPLEGRLETFRRFMKNFEEVCLKPFLRVKLVIAYSSSVSSPYKHKAIMKEYQNKYPLASLVWLDVAGNFSRGSLLSLAADKLNQTSLMFLCDVDLVFSKAFIDRCRMNTVLGK